MINIVAKLLEVKIAGQIDSLEKTFRNRLDVLYKIVHGGARASLIEACALARLSGAETAWDHKAVLGKDFCENVVSVIDSIYAGRNSENLLDLKDKLVYLIKLIDENKYLPFDTNGKINEFSEVSENKNVASDFQFEHASILAAMILSGSTKNFLRAKVKAGGEIRNQLARITSSAITLLDMLKEIEAMTLSGNDNEEEDFIPDRFKAQRADLTRNEIEWFLLNYGDEYGIPDKDSWEIVMRKAPWLRARLTTIINSLRRGHSPYNDIKKEIDNVLGK